jgi:hypothetical protein
MRFVKHTVGVLLLLVLASSFAAGCAATKSNLDTTPVGTGPNAMLDQTTVGKNRCDTGEITQSPFVVEWDATDLSTFEAKASRDVVFVQYEGCSLELIYGCSDNSIPGKYGRYQEPIFTSGTVESLKIKNEDELYAKLPLGAAMFGANVKMGENLELQYYVSGVVNSTRQQVLRKDIENNPRCEKATHFVSAYNLGAFQLLAYKGGTAGAGVGTAAVGVGGKTTSESENLKQGGSVESCESQAQLRCRVPIRLVLQPIEVAAPAEDETAAAAPVAPVVNVPGWEDTPQGKGQKLIRSAEEKERAGDGTGCLEDLGRAQKFDPQLRKNRQVMYLDAICTMRSGRCGQGKKKMTNYLKSIDEKHKTKDKAINTQVEEIAKNKCVLAQQQNLQAQVQNIMAAIGEAQSKMDFQGCKAEAPKAEKLFKKININDVQERNSVAGIMSMVSTCLSALEQCKLAKKYWYRYYEMAFSTMMSHKELISTADQTFRCEE